MKLSPFARKNPDTVGPKSMPVDSNAIGVTINGISSRQIGPVGRIYPVAMYAEA